MRSLALALGLMMALTSAIAQQIPLPPNAIKYGACLGAWITASQAHSWMFVGAANGDDIKRKIFSDQAVGRGVHVDDFEFVMTELQRPGKELADVIANPLSPQQVVDLANKVALRCLRRNEVAVGAATLARCLVVANVASAVFSWRYSEVSKEEAEGRIETGKLANADEAFGRALTGMVDRIYGSTAVVNAFPEFMRPNQGRWAANDEFGRCVIANAD